MLRNKKVLLLVGLIGLILVLSGCTQVNEPITSESEGFWNTVFVYPLSQVITFFADILGNSYGLAIIVVTVIICFILLPFNVKTIKITNVIKTLQPLLQNYHIN